MGSGSKFWRRFLIESDKKQLYQPRKVAYRTQIQMFKLTFLAVCAVLIATQNSFSKILNPTSFDATIRSTPVIAIVQVEKGTDTDALHYGRDENVSNQIVLSLKKNIKGDAPEKISFDPKLDINSDYYFNRSFSIEEGNNFLVRLIPDNKEGLKLRPECASLIPLSQAAISLVDESLTPEQNIEQILAKGCEEESLRRLSVFLLSQFHTKSAMQFLARYVNDKDDTIADDALANFARNQQVSAIPMIVARAPSFTFGSESGPLISGYKVKEAKPFLEKAMFGYPSGIRLNSVIALSNMANRDSVPFLLLALYDQDPQKFVAPYSCAVLHKVLPELPDNFSTDQFEKQKTGERQLFFSWWHDELAGKHWGADAKDSIELKDGQTHDAEELPMLNQALFMHSETTRRSAIQVLGKLADESSVPYLLVALRDPQGDVAFGAHQILARLIPELGPVLSRSAFDARQAQVAEAGAQWWPKHLQGLEEARWQTYQRQMDEEQRQLMQKMKLEK